MQPSITRSDDAPRGAIVALTFNGYSWSDVIDHLDAHWRGHRCQFVGSVKGGTVRVNIWPTDKGQHEPRAFRTQRH